MINHERSGNLLILFSNFLHCRFKLVPRPTILRCGGIRYSRCLKRRLIDNHTYCRIVYTRTIKLAVSDTVSVKVIRIQGSIIERKHIINIRIEVGHLADCGQVSCLCTVLDLRLHISVRNLIDKCGHTLVFMLLVKLLDDGLHRPAFQRIVGEQNLQFHLPFLCRLLTGACCKHGHSCQ